MRTFVYKFEMSEEEWLSIHGRLDEAIRLLHELANDDYTSSKAIEADDALSDLESAIDDYEFKYESEEEPKMGEERVTLNMAIGDYGYVVNVLKSIQRNLLGSNIETSSMLIGIAGSINILKRSIVEEPEEGIEMSEEEWCKIRNSAMQKTEEESSKPTSGRYEWKTNMPVYGPDPWKEIDILKETIKTQSDMISDALGRIIPLTDMYNDHEDRMAELCEEVDNIKDLLKSYDNADRALNRRLLSIENQLGREFCDYKNKVTLDIASINDRINDYAKRLVAISNKTDRLHEMSEANDSRITSLHIKLDNKIDILDERMKNLVQYAGRIENNVTNIEKDKKKIWDIVTGSDDSLDERFEGLKHTMECLIERDDCFFNKVKDLKNDMKELAQMEADKHNRLAMQVQSLNDFVEGKYDKGKLDIDSASFNIYFNRNKKEEDDG